MSTVDTDALVAWLREALEEDERVINGSCIHIEECNGSGYGDRFDDARMLAEVEAKRRILDAYRVSCDAAMAAESTPLAGATRMSRRIRGEAVLALAQPYASRPGFRPEWRLT